MSNLEIDENKVSAESVPESLLSRDRWVCWRYQNGGDKKPPYDPETGENASIHQPDTWTDFETALDRFRKVSYDGVGFVLTSDDPFAGVDFDDCRDPNTGELKQDVKDIIDRLNSFSEISPSGTGIHTIIFGKKADKYRNVEGIEVYDSERYFTVTGEHLKGTPEAIKPRSEELEAVCERYLTENPPKQQTKFADLPEDRGNAERIEEAREYIRDFLYAPETGPRPPNYFTDLLKGRYADRGFEGDRSGGEITLSSLTYGIFLDGGVEPERVRKLTYHYITHAAKKNPYTTSEGKLRKWLEGSPNRQQNYRQRTLDYAIKNFNPEIWNRWRQSGKRTSTDDYSKHAYEIALDALYNLTVEHSTLANPPTLSTNNTPATCGYRKCENPYPTLGKIAERARGEYELSEDSYREILRRIRRDGGAKMARLGSSTYVYYPASYPDPPDACYVRVDGEKLEAKSGSSEEASEQEVMTDGGAPMSKTESHDELERIRQSQSDEQKQSVGSKFLECPLNGQSMLTEGALRNHASQSQDEDHRGMTLNDSLEPVEKHKVEDLLREQYVDQGKTSEDLENDWGATRGAIHYYMKKFDIDRRPPVAKPVQWASFGLDNSGYERAQSSVPGTKKKDSVQIHQLIAIADGADPHRVFSGGEFHCHHRNGCRWDNRPDNIELISREQHQRIHRSNNWKEENGIPVLENHSTMSEEEIRSLWGPGIPKTSEQAADYFDENQWGPGPSM